VAAPSQRFSAHFAVSLWIYESNLAPSTDENGRAIHRDCYVESLASESPKQKEVSLKLGAQVEITVEVEAP
jgi:hypothetical protein